MRLSSVLSTFGHSISKISSDQQWAYLKDMLVFEYLGLGRFYVINITRSVPVRPESKEEKGIKK